MTNSPDQLKALLTMAYRAGFIEACQWPEPVSQDVDSSAFNARLDKFIEEHTPMFRNIRHAQDDVAETFPEYCQWDEDEDGNWNTSCDEIHILIDGTPDDNSMKFCCYCGEELMQHRFDFSDDAAMAARGGE